MTNTNRLTQKWAGCFACILAVALITGCKPANEQASTSPATSAAAPAAPAPAAEPAPVATPAPDATAAPAAPPTAPVVVTPPVRIDCGATDKLTDSEGNVWLADEGSADGDTFGVDDAVITNTPDSAIYQTERYGMTAYNFAVPNGKYIVKLHFAEVYSGITDAGQRVFSFNVQGHEFKDFDIWVKAGGFDKAYVESVNVEVTDGKLNITFTPNVENPKISGIEILPRT
ncbi:MAG TPA: malectin [Verrucomicrobiae bacterium]